MPIGRFPTPVIFLIISLEEELITYTESYTFIGYIHEFVIRIISNI